MINGRTLEAASRGESRIKVSAQGQRSGLGSEVRPQSPGNPARQG